MTISKLPTSASLKEVMDKFEEISLRDLNSINIKVMSELPNTAKEGDIIIICDYEYTKIIVSTKEPTLNNNEIWLSVLENEEANIKANKVDFISTVVDSQIKTNSQLKRLNLYKYSNGGFVHINGDFDIYIAPNYYNTDIYGAMNSCSYANETSQTNTKKDTDEGIEISITRSKTGYSLRNLYTQKKIDLTQYKTLEIKYKITGATGGDSYLQFFAGVASSASEEGLNGIRDSYLAYNANTTLQTNLGKEITVNTDVSSMTTSAYVKVASYVSSASSLKILVKSIRLLR